MYFLHYVERDNIHDNKQILDWLMLAKRDGILSERAQRILKRLYGENKEVVKTSLLSSVPNSYSLDRYLNELFEDTLINIREEKIVRKTFYISITQKGREVAEQLRKAEAISKGQKFPATDRYAVILHLYRNGPMNMKEINDALPGSTEILRDLQKLKVIRQEEDSSKYLQETRLELTEKGKEIGELIEKLERMKEE